MSRIAQNTTAMQVKKQLYKHLPVRFSIDTTYIAIDVLYILNIPQDGDSRLAYKNIKLKDHMTKRSVGLERLGGGDNFPYLSGQVRNFATCVYCTLPLAVMLFGAFWKRTVLS